MSSNKDHWQRVFSAKKETEVSWYQAHPQTSITLFEQCQLAKDAPIIDVGCGDGHFIDYLLDKGYYNITALDISEEALNRLRGRLGQKGRGVHWVVSDIVSFQPTTGYDFWHDRACFHFQTEQDSIEKYRSLVQKAIWPKGYQMIATFSKTGPEKCSGLTITQYTVESLAQFFEPEFSLIASIEQTHVTPFNTNQDFVFCLMQRA